MLAEQSPANEVGRVVRASGSPPARQRGYGRRGRICLTRPALVLAGRSGGCLCQLDPVDGRLEQSLRLGSIPTAAVHNAGGHAVVAVLHELVPNLPCRETIPVNGRTARRDAVVVAGRILRHSLRQKRACLVFSPARVRRPDAACGSVVARDGR